MRALPARAKSAGPGYLTATGTLGSQVGILALRFEAALTALLGSLKNKNRLVTALLINKAIG